MTKRVTLANAHGTFEDKDNFSGRGATSVGELKLVATHYPGNLSIAKNKLKSLAGSPKTVYGAFSCAYNELTDLVGGPEEVGETYECQGNKLRSLKGAPDYVYSFLCNGNPLESLKDGPTQADVYNCSECQLTSLEGAPHEVTLDFQASFNKLKDLRGGPKAMSEHSDIYDVSDNELVSLEGAPLTLVRFDASNNKSLTSLHGIGTDFLKHVKRIDLTGCPIKSHALGLLLIRGLELVEGEFPGLEIINSYIGKDGALIDCQHHLIEEGLDELAQL